MNIQSKMSGKELARILASIGFPGADDLHDGTNADWMFDNTQMLPFLEWICDTINEANMVMPAELENYQQLEAQEGVLEGPLLEEALNTITASDPAPIEHHNLQESVRLLEKEVEHAVGRKKLLHRQHQQLAFCLTSQTDRLCKMDSVEKTANTDYKQQMQKTYAECRAKSKIIEELVMGVHELSIVYQQAVDGQDDQMAMCLSQVPITHYHSTEEKFTQELTLFTRKLFFDGIAKIAGEVDGVEYKFLEVQNPDSLLVKGEREEVILEDCKELACLQACYSQSKADKMQAQVKETAYSSACSFLEQKLDILKEKPYSGKINTLSGLIQAAQSGRVQLQSETSRLTDTLLPRLIKDSAALQITKVLHGDYNLKIARQDYFTLNQNQVIEELILQRSRNELLTMAFEVETRNLRMVHHLLTAAILLLRKNCDAAAARKCMMQESVLTPSRHQRSTVDSRDIALTLLHNVMEGADGTHQQLFLTFEQLLKEAKAVQEGVRSVNASLITTSSSQHQRLRLLEQELRHCERMVYGDSGSQSSQLVLSPHQITYTLSQLDTMLKKLEQAVLDIVKDIEHRKKSLKMDSLQAKQRKLFIYMFNNPDHLRRALADVQARMQAQLVS